MLLVVASIAAVAFIVRDYMRVRNAREHFKWMNAGWQTQHISLDEIILASEGLALAEAESPWISQQAATKRHIEFLNRLLAYLNSGTIESHPDNIDRWRRKIRENIHKHLQT